MGPAGDGAAGVGTAGAVVSGTSVAGIVTTFAVAGRAPVTMLDTGPISSLTISARFWKSAFESPLLGLPVERSRSAAGDGRPCGGQGLES